MKLCEEDLRKVVWLSDPALSPNGETAVYVRAESDYKTGKNVPKLFSLSLTDGTSGPVSRLTCRQHTPRFSPDGALLAFCSDDEGVGRLFVKNMITGEEKQLTSFGVGDYAWSPDGKSIALCAPLPRDRRGNPMRVESREEWEAWKREMDHAPRFTEELMYKLDEAFGFLDGSGGALYLADVGLGSAELLTETKAPCSLPSFSADGKRLYYYALTGERERSLFKSLFCMDLSSRESRQVRTLRPVEAVFPAAEKDGGLIYAAHSEENQRTELFLLDEQAGNELPLLPKDETEGVDPALIGDDRNGSMGLPVRMGEDGKPVYLTARDGRIFLCFGEGKEFGPRGCIQAFSDVRKGKAVILKSAPDHPGELYLTDVNTGIETRLTHENDWIGEVETALPEKVAVSAGDHTVHGWALLPEGTEPCPAVLYIHGGPECFYGEDIFFFEAQTLRSAGFAVLWCNPRGSAGYGPKYLSGAYGEEAANDLLAFADACADRFPQIDRERLGVTGGSYGGYMTNKLTLLTDRFRAAAAQRTWIDPATSYGTGDMGFISGSGQTDFRAYMLNRARGSVLRDIGKLNTPTLILHGEADVRCGEEQADQLFNMIRALRPEVPCRLVVFPGENHSLTRTGLIHNRIRHMVEIRRWMEKYLKGSDEAQ